MKKPQSFSGRKNTKPSEGKYTGSHKPAQSRGKKTASSGRPDELKMPRSFALKGKKSAGKPEEKVITKKTKVFVFDEDNKPKRPRIKKEEIVVKKRGRDEQFSEKRKPGKNTFLQDGGREKTVYKKDFSRTGTMRHAPYRKNKKQAEKTEKEQQATGLVRLNKFIANAGICSRREADTLIEQGLITVNGKVITEVGTKVKHDDVVKYNGSRIKPETLVYILLNKPKDYITTTDDEKGRKTVMDLVADASPERLFPVGRLDRNTTGVLLLTNDGDVSQALTHPRFQIRKIYHVVTDKKVSGDDLNKLVEGVHLEDGYVRADAAAYVEKEDKRNIGVEIHSGRNRVVRRMFEHLGYEVEKLDRVAFGEFTKKNVERGRYRFLTDREIAYLMKLKKKL